MVLNLDYTFEIKSVSSITSGFRIETCDTLNLCTGKTVEINGIDYLITGFKLNEFIEVEGVDPITVSSFQVSPLSFDYGTLLDVNTERVDYKKFQEERLPFFWLRTPYTYTKGDFDNPFVSADLTFYMFDSVLLIGGAEEAGQTWYTQRHEEWVIEPLQNLLDKRIEKYINENQDIFSTIPDYTVRGMVLAGTEDSKGFQSTLFDELLSGIEVRINLDFQKEGCNC